MMVHASPLGVRVLTTARRRSATGGQDPRARKATGTLTPSLDAWMPGREHAHAGRAAAGRLRCPTVTTTDADLTLAPRRGLGAG